MKPESDLCNLRPLSRTSLSGLPPDSAAVSAASAALCSLRKRRIAHSFALLGLTFGTVAGIAQQPTPIPNWTTGEPGTSSGQYAPTPQAGQSPQQYGEPQYEQPPSYQQPPADDPNYNQQQAYASPDDIYAPYQPVSPAPAVTPDRLEQMVAPIALYPDNLVSMVLAASTYPAEISAADQWLHAQGGASPEQIAAGANAQTGWDPSVKALTAFPQVLDMLAQNLQWTTDLGNAYYNQPQDVMQTIQVMRSRAEAAGNLQSTPQQEVIEDQGTIEIAPPTPQVVYVPTYDPWAVYGQPVAVYPGFNWVGDIGSGVASAFISWGPGIAVEAFAATPFGWLGWGLDWFSHAIFFNNDVWCSHSFQVRDWGFAHGGYRYWGPRGEMARFRERGGWGGRGGWGERGWGGRGGYGERRGFGGHGGYDAHVFRSGLDRGRFSGARPVLHGGPNRGGERAFGNQGGYGHGSGGNGNTWGRGNGYQSSGNTYQHGGNSYGQNGHGFGFGYGSNNGGNNTRGSGYGQNGNTYQRGGNSYGQNGGHGFGFGYGSNNGGGYGRGNSGYPQNGRGNNGYPQNGRGNNGYGQNSYGNNGRGNNGYGQNSYGNNGRGSNGYAQNGYGNSGAQRGYGREPQPTGGPQQHGGFQQNYDRGRMPQPVGGPQQFGGGRQFAQSPRGTQQAYGRSYGTQSYGSGAYNRPLQNYGMRPGFGGSYSQPYRAPNYSGGNRSYSYGGSSAYGGGYNYGHSNIARNPSSGGLHIFGGGGGHSSGGYNYGGGGQAPKAPSFSNHSFGGGRSWGGGGGGFKAPHFSGGGGHFGGGGHSGGSFGGGHSGGGHSGGGHGGHHH